MGAAEMRNMALRSKFMELLRQDGLVPADEIASLASRLLNEYKAWVAGLRAK